jgi:hypothetical protein
MSEYQFSAHYANGAAVPTTLKSHTSEKSSPIPRVTGHELATKLRRLSARERAALGAQIWNGEVVFAAPTAAQAAAITRSSVTNLRAFALLEPAERARAVRGGPLPRSRRPVDLPTLVEALSVLLAACEAASDEQR